MKIEDCRISILIGNDKTRIEVKDNTSTISFLRLELTPDQLSRTLSRQMYVEVDSAELVGVEKIGKKMQHDKFVFELIGEQADRQNRDKVYELAIEKLIEANMTEWIPDSYFGAKDSFYTQDGKTFARATIRRWI